MESVEDQNFASTPEVRFGLRLSSESLLKVFLATLSMICVSGFSWRDVESDK